MAEWSYANTTILSLYVTASKAQRSAQKQLPLVVKTLVNLLESLVLQSLIWLLSLVWAVPQQRLHIQDRPPALRTPSIRPESLERTRAGIG